MPGSGAVSGPALPVVERQADTPGPYAGDASATEGAAQGTPADAPRRTSAPGNPGAHARGGLGAPLSALPPSAELPGSAASRASRTAPGPDVQRAPARQDQSSTAAPVPPAGAGPLAPGADAPLLGTVDVQRHLADHAFTGGTTEAAPADHANGPATPLVTPPPAAVPHGLEPAGAVGTEGAAANARRPGTAPGGPGAGGSRSGRPGSGRQRLQGPAAPGPVVVARAVASGTQLSGPADPRPLTVTRSAAHSVAAASRTLSLLAARPLTLSTRAPEGAAPSAAARSGGRPVVTVRWPGAPAAPTASHHHSAAPAHPAPRPSAPAPATPHVQRDATAHPARQDKDTGVRTTVSLAPVQRVPVVRPAPPRPVSAGTTAAVPARPLPVTAPQAPPLTGRPSAAPAPVGPVPVVRPRTVTPGSGPTAGAATPVQRDVTETGGVDLLKGVPVRQVPAKAAPMLSRSRSSSGASASSTSSGSSAFSGSSVSSSASGKTAARRPATAQDDPGIDLDDLARRLLDPVSRLLRTELRRGRERTGRPYDGRR
ncbi:hypothetical protein ACFWOJ_25320 [Streptomyces sp. NPDC058439]|uniref:hypothetical protein n=1 Tax=Streptomyces sp. NPDC058439 TaxID=3346500 RepID=UPI003652C965